MKYLHRPLPFPLLKNLDRVVERSKKERKAAELKRRGHTQFFEVLHVLG
jgi:hypothetical protein